MEGPYLLQVQESPVLEEVRLVEQGQQGWVPMLTAVVLREVAGPMVVEQKKVGATMMEGVSLLAASS